MCYPGSEKATLKPDSDLEKISKDFLADLSGDELLRRWKAGDERAAGILFDRYSLRLVALVASRLNRKFRDAVAPEDRAADGLETSDDHIVFVVGQR